MVVASTAVISTKIMEQKFEGEPELLDGRPAPFVSAGSPLEQS
jgi:hypothetical protein